VTASNAGVINAQFTGGTAGSAYGAIIVGNGDLVFTNSGSITAAGPGQTVGVELSSDISTTLDNSGTISGGAAILTGDSSDTIGNTGTITGAIFTNGGNDTLTNGASGVWHVIGYSDFGSGDDTIANAGTIVLNDGAISLGDSDTFANAFTNSGTIAAFGDSIIDMGAQNTNAFTNTGIIDFRDGAPDDMLTISGDFAGSGQIGVDVSGLNGTGDLLYVNGNVVDGSVTSINANILDVPTTATGSIDVVRVSGDSTAGSFVLGDVTFDTTRSFLTVLGVGLQSSIDTSNATADVFSVDFDVSGLSDAGTLAAAFAPGVQSLMNSQVGTWRQRMGVIDKTTHGPSVWARAFQESGTVDPGHVASNFGQDGNFAFDQRNSGAEVGLDYGVSDQFSVGLLLGKADARQQLNAPGVGVSKLSGNTQGVYATWISPNGFYVDGSYRQMDFDAKLYSAAGETRTDGKANAFNLEAGYAWTLGNGFKIEPQLQYTRTTVDDVDTLAGALAGFTPDGGTSSRGRLGVAVRKSFDTGVRVWTPYATVSSVREFDGENAYSIDGNFFGSTSTEGTSALVEAGLNVQSGNLSVFGGLNWQDGGALDSVVGGQVGVRYSW
jgi:outer membrane autotransporter protein